MRKKHIDPAAGRRLSEIRQYRGISQGELAKALAVKVGTIQGYEHARIDISATRLDQLARGLKCETADLVMPPGAPLPRYLYHLKAGGSSGADGRRGKVPSRRATEGHASHWDRGGSMAAVAERRHRRGLDHSCGRRRGDAIDFAERQKFDGIDPALAALEPGHECLSLAQLARKFRLPNAGADARIDQSFDQFCDAQIRSLLKA